MNLCPFCHTGHQVVEHSMYDRHGNFIKDADKRTSWIVKCKRCGARSKNGRSKLDAIAKWNLQDFTYLTWATQGEHMPSRSTVWNDLRDAIVMAQVDDLKTAAMARACKSQQRGKLEGEDWFYSEGYKRLTSIPGEAVVRAVKEQASYDVWRKRHGCASCKRYSCAHKQAYLWTDFRDGKAPDCPRNETIKRNEDGSMDVRAFLEVHRRE
jgi:hypothetical protein